MIGLILFLVGVYILILLAKAIIEEVVDPPSRQKVTKIVVLLICFFALLWLAGFGGWGHVYGWRP